MILSLALSPSLDVTYLLDAVTAGEIHRPREVLRLAGGKGLNLARATVALGSSVSVVAPLGGHVGALVADGARATGIELHAIEASGETRCCVTAIPDDGPAPTEFYEPAAPLAPAEWTALESSVSSVPPAAWTALSGSVPTGSPLERVVDLLLVRRALGDRLAVDSHGPLMHLLLHRVRPEVVKVNRSEAIELLTGVVAADASALELAGGLHAITGGIAVVTDGAAGSAAVDASGAWLALPDSEPGRYAVGSGDSFLAGLLVGLTAGAAVDGAGALPDALALAAAAGSANTRRPGAAVFSADDLAAARGRVAIREGAPS